ncbi:MAG: hypothetical protein IT305_22055 [Chloroflexi bacterium]|nr:hypothetical protein [Chloroflexota bacterium]
MADGRFATTAKRLRDLASDADSFARFNAQLGPFLRTPLTADEARRRLQQRLEHRERRFLTLVNRAIYHVPHSPYRRLLAHAGCELGDLRRLVAQEGIEGALTTLTRSGVYVTFDEFKGRRAVVRGSARFTFTDRDFDNPLCPSEYVEFTGGSRGQPSRVRRSFASAMEGASSYALTLAAHRIANPRNVLWLGGPLTWLLILFKLGQSVDAWLYPIEPLPWFVPLGARYLALHAAASGHRMPMPEYCDLREPEAIVHRLVDATTAGTPLVMNSTAGSAVRVAAMAEHLGISLPGVTFHCRNEPLTVHRRRQIEAVGARVLTSYATVEIPYISYGCPAADAADDSHFCHDRYAVVERQRPAHVGGPTVSALLLTSLSRFAPKILVNVEPGDSARIEQRDCGCLLGSLGLRTHLSEIRSFEKFSSEGTSFARTNLVAILEGALPTRFGGMSLDYQLVEEEAPDGAARLVLRIDPSVGPLDDAAVKSMLLDEMARGGFVDAYHARLIRRADAIVVQRLSPLATRAGKVLPFHLAAPSSVMR